MILVNANYEIMEVRTFMIHDYWPFTKQAKPNCTVITHDPYFLMASPLPVLASNTGQHLPLSLHLHFRLRLLTYLHHFDIISTCKTNRTS